MEHPTEEPRLERMPTGIHGLDTIVGGGLIRGGIYIIQGQPGSGKTVLGNQVCFNHIGRGERAVYVTLLAESHARMLLNIGGMSFYRADAIPRDMYYVSALRALEEEGLKGLLELIRRELRAHGASLLVLDGLVAAEDASPSDQDFKKFIHELQNQNSLANCTTLLLTSGGNRSMRPERTMVDGLVELTDPIYGSRRERRLEVSKFRGAAHLRGQHAFQITNDGIVVYPRIEALLSEPKSADPCGDQRVTSGIAGLDEMLHGGYLRGTTSLIIGPPGSGKTSAGLHFIAPSGEDARGAYLSFYETPERACLKAERMGLDLEARMRRDEVRYFWRPTTEWLIDAIGNELLDYIRRTRISRLFIDGWDGLNQLAADRERLVPFFTALANECRVREITTLCTVEAHRILCSEFEPPPRGVSAIAENVVFLQLLENKKRLERGIAVLKVRDSSFDPLARKFVINGAGIQIEGTRRSARKAGSRERSSTRGSSRGTARKRRA